MIGILVRLSRVFVGVTIAPLSRAPGCALVFGGDRLPQHPGLSSGVTVFPPRPGSSLGGPSRPAPWNRTLVFVVAEATASHLLTFDAALGIRQFPKATGEHHTRPGAVLRMRLLCGPWRDVTGPAAGRRSVRSAEPLRTLCSETFLEKLGALFGDGGHCAPRTLPITFREQAGRGQPGKAAALSVWSLRRVFRPPPLPHSSRRE